MRRPILLASCLLVFSVQGQENSTFLPSLSNECAFWLQGPQFQKKFTSIDPDDGRQELDNLIQLNHWLEAKEQAGALTSELLYQAGILKLDAEEQVQDQYGRDQPFRIARMPFAFTGVYLPTKKRKILDGNGHDGVMILLPGIGMEVSKADSLWTMASRFVKGDGRLFRRDPTSDKLKLRMVAVPSDVTLNGLQDDAPYCFASPEGTTAVVRHIHLILRTLYPGKPVVIFGRSQGGLIAIQYARHFGDFALAIAGNPSHTDSYVIETDILAHEDKEYARVNSLATNEHPRAWDAYKRYTYQYDGYRHPSLTQVLVQLGTQDASYPQPYYGNLIWGWRHQHSTHRIVQVFDAKHHLYRDNFDEVVSAMIPVMVPLVYP